MRVQPLARSFFCTFCIYAKINAIVVSLIIETGVFRCSIATAIVPIAHAKLYTHKYIYTHILIFFVNIMTFVIVFLAAYANAADPYLEILPNGETQTKPVGSSIILTCRPKVDNPTLVSEMQWLDPQNRVIESLK